MEGKPGLSQQLLTSLFLGPTPGVPHAMDRIYETQHFMGSGTEPELELKSQ
jgi:hypothetical protein